MPGLGSAVVGIIVWYEVIDVSASAIHSTDAACRRLATASGAEAHGTPVRGLDWTEDAGGVGGRGGHPDGAGQLGSRGPCRLVVQPRAAVRVFPAVGKRLRAECD